LHIPSAIDVGTGFPASPLVQPVANRAYVSVPDCNQPGGFFDFGLAQQGQERAQRIRDPMASLFSNLLLRPVIDSPLSLGPDSDAQDTPVNIVIRARNRHQPPGESIFRHVLIKRLNAYYLSPRCRFWHCREEPFHSRFVAVPTSIVRVFNGEREPVWLRNAAIGVKQERPVLGWEGKAHPLLKCCQRFWTQRVTGVAEFDAVEVEFTAGFLGRLHGIALFAARQSSLESTWPLPKSKVHLSLLFKDDFSLNRLFVSPTKGRWRIRPMNAELAETVLGGS
jgi:hypothetical protein